MIEIHEAQRSEPAIVGFPKLMKSYNDNIYLMTKDRQGFRLTGPGTNWTWVNDGIEMNNLKDYEGAVVLENVR